MKSLGFVALHVLATGMVAFASPADASVADCKAIANPMKRLACYDRATNSTTPAGKLAVVSPVQSTDTNLIPVKALGPVTAGPRFWFEADGGIYSLSKNQPILAATTATNTGNAPIPTAPGFIGLVSFGNVTNPLVTGASPDFAGGGNYRMGYWLDPGRTMAVEGSAFFVRGTSRFDASQTPTTVRTSTFVNTTPDTFVGLFDDVTTTTMAGAIRDQLYGADANFRVRAPYFGILPNFDVMMGMRYVALDEKLTASVESAFSRTFQPALGIPAPTNFNNSSSGSDVFRIRNDFIGPQVGFSAEQHWGRFWVANESKLAVGAMMENLSVSGSTVSSTTPTRPILLAGIPLNLSAGGPPVTSTTNSPLAFGLFAQGDRRKTVLAFVPSGTIKAGYDINDALSLTLAYNYLYMSSVGRVGDQIASPNDIRQSGFFAQGITTGFKAKF